MFKLYIKFFSLLCLLPFVGTEDTYGQIRASFGNKTIVENKTIVRNKEKASAKVKARSSKTEEDTVYAISLKKQHGWTMPLQVVDKKDIHRYNKIYRFSRKNASGNWCRVECIDGHGNYVPESFQTYIVKANSESESDVKASYVWRLKMQRLCRIDIISDPLGEKVIQERAYDNDGNLVFSFSISPINSDGKVFVGNYRDNYGLPAEMRPDKGFTYGTLVYIERDRWGNDSIVKYMDSKGYVKPNSDGVYCHQYIYDELGRLISERSMDSNGGVVNDESGVCGVEYTYDKKHNRISASYSNTDLGLDVDKESQRYQYDDLNRLTEIQYVNQQGNPKPNSSGTQKVTYAYNDYGDICMICGYDKDGNPSPYDEDEICKTTYVCDDKGNLLEYHNFNALGNPTEGKNRLRFSSLIASFDPLNNLIKEIRYKTYDNTEIPYNIFEKQDTVQTTRYSDNSSMVETFSRDGRKVSKVYLDAEGKLDSRRAIEEYVYDVPREEIPYSNQYVSDYVNLEIEKGSNRRPTVISYINQDDSYKIYTRFENDSLTSINGRAYRNKRENRFNNLNGLGHVSYCSEYGFRHAYNKELLYGLSPVNEICVFGTDEFNEPNYILDESDMLYCYRIATKSDDYIYLDDENIPIQDFQAFMDDCPKYLCVGVVDSKGFEYGFCENDIILSINDRYIYPYESDSEFSIRKSLMSVLLANEDKFIKVFRIDPVSFAISIKDISVGEGNLEDYGVKLHCYYATPRQHERISALASGISVSESKESYKDKNNPIVVVSNSSWEKDRRLPYAVQNGRDAVLLAAQIKDFPLVNWSYGDGLEKIQRILQSRGDVSDYTDSIPVLRLYVTNDGKTVNTVDAKRLDLGCQLLLGYVDSDTQKRLKSIANSIAFKNNEDIFSLKNNFKDHCEAFKDSLYNRALVYDAFGRYDVSFDVLKRLALAGYSKALSNITDYYANGKGTKKDLHKAEKYAVEANDGGASLCLIASEIAKIGKYLQSEALLKKVSADDDYYDTALMRLGDLYFGKDSVMAMDYYFNALKNSKSIPRNGETAHLISKIRNIDTKISTMDSIFTIGLKFASEEKYKEEFPIFKALVDCNYESAIYLLTWCLMYGEGTESNPDMAVKLAEEVFTNSGNFGGLYVASKAYLDKGQYIKAIDLLSKGCDKGKHQFLANYYLGSLYANPEYYANNTSKAIKYWVDAALKYDYKLPTHQDKLDKIEDYFKSIVSQYQEAASGLFFLGWNYLDNMNEKALYLIRIGYETAPDLLSKYKHFNKIYYYAMHKNGIPSKEEYESFMSNKIAVLSVPDDVKENDPLFAYKGKKYKIISLNNWNNSPDSIKINLFDENRNDNVLVIEVDSKPVEIRTSKLDSFNIIFEEISR